MYRSIAHPWIEYQCVGPTIRPSCNPRPSIQPHSYVSFFFLFLFSISNLQHVSKKRHCNNGGEKKKRSEKPVWISKRGGPRVSTRDRKSSNQQGILITLAPLFEFERTIDPKKRERERGCRTKDVCVSVVISHEEGILAGCVYIIRVWRASSPLGGWMDRWSTCLSGEELELSLTETLGVCWTSIRRHWRNSIKSLLQRSVRINKLKV